MRRFAVAAVAAGPLLMAAVHLGDATKKAFDNYIREIESQMDAEAKSKRLSVLDRLGGEKQQALKGQIVAVPFVRRAAGGVSSLPITEGLINHWVGGMFIPNANVAQVRSVLEDYPDYKWIYAPDVIESKLLSRNGDEFNVFLRLHRQVRVKMAFGYNFPVEFNANYRVNYFDTGGVLQARSISTRIAEVKDPKKSHTDELQVEYDSGYLWRLNSYWRVYPSEQPAGVFVECEAVSLSRSVPGFVERMVTYFTTNFPEDSMRKTLEATRRSVTTRFKGR